MASSPGTVDYRNGEFVAHFEYVLAVVDEIKCLQRRRWNPATKEWLVAHHYPSAAGLLRIARGHHWRISAAARAVLRALQEQADATEYSVDVVQGSGGEPWFFCKLGDDDELQRRVAAIPEAFLDGAEWWVPAYRADCAELLLEIVESDKRLGVSNAGWRLLDEPDEYWLLESQMPPHAERPAQPLGLQAATERFT